MPRIPVKTNALPTRGPYSYVVEARPKRLLFVSGLLAVDSQGNLVGEGDMKAQITQIVYNLKRLL
ncbi:MAG: RidA family protein, partial [Thaumarchaeota archaeon]|nr:RidA family protein [Nitrososphaerota archaeon]